MAAWLSAARIKWRGIVAKRTRAQQHKRALALARIVAAACIAACNEA